VLKVYDTLEIPLKAAASFSDRIASFKLAVESCSDPLKSEIPFRSNLYYRQVVDLRKVAEIDAILHLNAKKTGTHKIQIIEAGRKYQGQIADTIAEIVNDHPDLLGVSRVDSCADIVDGPKVSWIAQSVRARSAQWQAELGAVELHDEAGRTMAWSEMGKREVQSMYMGKRPNCFRVYNKLAERLHVWKLEKRRHEKQASQIVVDKATEGAPECRYTPHAFWARAMAEYRAVMRRKELLCSGRYYLPFPDFTTWFVAHCTGSMSNVVQMRVRGHEEPEQMKVLPQLPKVLTRVERQMAAGRVPPELDTFEKLFSKQALDFNPFERLDFSSFAGETQIARDDYSPVEFAAGMQFKQWLETGMSYQQLYAYWNGKRNAKAIAEKFAPFVAAANPPKEVSISSADLYDRYRSSVSRQRAA
jgi:hypothetical protein